MHAFTEVTFNEKWRCITSAAELCDRGSRRINVDPPDHVYRGKLRTISLHELQISCRSTLQSGQQKNA